MMQSACAEKDEPTDLTAWHRRKIATLHLWYLCHLWTQNLRVLYVLRPEPPQRVKEVEHVLAAQQPEQPAILDDRELPQALDLHFAESRPQLGLRPNELRLAERRHHV